jgi:hypothetical protein
MRKRYILLTAVACVVVVYAMVKLSGPPEPVYEGKRLRQWVWDWKSTHEDNETLRRMGTNAIPLLLGWMRHEHRDWSRALPRRAPAFVQKALKTDTLTRADVLADKSVLVYVALGTNGIVGMPALLEMLRQTNALNGAYRATTCLAALGTNGLPALMSVIHDPMNPLRIAATSAIRRFQTNSDSSRIVGPVFLRLATDPSGTFFTARFAGEWLREVKYAPGVSIPALVGVITNSAANEDVRCQAAVTVGGYGALATNALTALSNRLIDPKRNIAYAASNAFWAITTNLATKIPPP